MDEMNKKRDAYRDELTHVDEHGDVRMVDVSEKATTKRVAIAEGTILMHPETQAMVLEDRAKKGDVLACARVAGIMAAKRTSELIPMCHPLMITKAKVDIEPIAADGRVGFHVTATCGVTGVTGIEMEALTAASVACLTIYDMCKAVDRGMEIVDVRLLRKEGGRSGLWEREASSEDGVAAVAVPVDMSAVTSAPVAVPAAMKQHVDAGQSQTADVPLTSEDPESPDGLSVVPTSATPAVAFIGYQNSGKTTLVEKVIAELVRRGLTVGTVKHHGHAGFDIDVPGKDSWRHAHAGSRHVGLICADRFAEYGNTASEMPLADMLARFTDVDVVLVEGYKAAGLPNVVVARSGVDRMRGASSLDLVDEATLAIACNDALAQHLHLKVPVLDINDAQAAADVVERFVRKR